MGLLRSDDLARQRKAEQSRSHFVAQAAHELRMPLTNIRIYVETAMDEGEADPAIRTHALGVISREAKRLERIVGEMLSLSEIEAGALTIRKDAVCIADLLLELREDYRAQAEDKKLTLVFDLLDTYPAIQGDRDKIGLALHNLLGNAIKYTNPGGTVTVSADVRDERLTIAVSDTGIGIAPQELELVFQKFYRSKDPRVGRITGTGLGLTLAREFFRLHGGDVLVQSRLNHGTTFTATVPVKCFGGVASC